MGLSGSDKQKINEALDVSFLTEDVRRIPQSELNLIVLSDQHRGRGNGADDFRKCKNAYHAALGFYYVTGHHLMLLGDVEELWETKIQKTIKEYKDTLMLERRFLLDNRYTRFLGNHDEVLAEDKYLKHLRPYIDNYKPRDAVKIIVTNSEDEPIAILFFVHGHQGKQYSWFAKFAVRHLWASIQKLTGVGSGVPSKNFELRRDHEKTMYEWVERKNYRTDGPPIYIICGHTHHPVFMSATWSTFVIEERERLKNKPAELKKFAERVAEYESGAAASNSADTVIGENVRPFYFNSGCCSFWDGDITGLEIDAEGIKLVRWPDDNGDPKKHVLRKETWKRILR